LLRTTKLCHSVEVIFRSSFCWYKLHLWLIGISQYSFHQSNAFYFIPRCPISITLFNVPFMILDVDLTQRYIFFTLLLFLFNKVMNHDREWKCFQNFVTYSVFHRPLTLTFQNLIYSWCDNLWMILFSLHAITLRSSFQKSNFNLFGKSNSSSLQFLSKETHINFAKL
jgi:hypothetical protein